MIRTTRGTAVGSTNLWVWAGLGALGSAGIAVFGTSIGAVPRPGPDRYWIHFTGVGSTLIHLGFYAGVLLLLGAWIAVGLQARRGGLTVARCWVLLGCWGLPLFLGPPVFSRDIYSYIAQGLLAHHGLNPYHVAPSALGNGRQLASVASVWRNTASPYGPLFVTVSRGTVTVAGASLDAQIIAFRAVELLGVGAIMVFLPRLARRMGADPGLALWLAALSPLALFSYVASGHNDALMVGLLVAGVALAIEDQLAIGTALCALGALIKLPAALAIVFLAVVAFQRASAHDRSRVFVKAVLVPGVVLVIGTVVAGYGWTWLSLSALRVPAELRILHSPSVSLGVFFSAIAHDIGIPVSTHAVVTVTQVLCGLIVVAGTLWLLWNAHRLNVVRAIGLALLLFAVGSPTLWPWYLLWGVTMLAATTAQRSRMLAAVAGLAMLLVGAGGSPMLHGLAYVVTAPLLLAGGAWFFWDRHWQTVVLGRVD
ncbi:MAG TPA: polyprenol phosphomannose-dependent alpha 1,6 mannosyltransferase MptB [Acidimicrobiales bacterium]|jgi:alpha-1,6-mannosyltransferase|nr:polyprenol phosphomannose-dependent alpha 1,6 mannosyltransferase MptB [Acidimicrobiales bacterium]